MRSRSPGRVRCLRGKRPLEMPAFFKDCLMNQLSHLLDEVGRDRRYHGRRNRSALVVYICNSLRSLEGRPFPAVVERITPVGQVRLDQTLVRKGMEPGIDTLANRRQDGVGFFLARKTGMPRRWIVEIP